MYLLYLSVIGISVFGGNFTRFQVMKVPIIYIVMLGLLVSYIHFFLLKRGRFQFKKSEKRLLIFETYGFIMVILSVIGMNRSIASNALYFSKTYIPRQAYYLFFLPAVVLFQDPSYTRKADQIVDKYGKIIFWTLYFIPIIITRKIAISLSSEIVLGWLALRNVGLTRKKYNFLELLVLVVTPVAVGGEITNLLVRLIYLFLFLFPSQKTRKIAMKTLGFALLGVISLSFILPWLDRSLSSFFEINSIWRLQYWKDELIELMKSKLLGVGYGTSYATANFTGVINEITSGPFAATAEYTTLEKVFVTGSHNSFISLAFRLGIVGIGSFILFVLHIYIDLRKARFAITSETIFAFFSVLILITFNVGLESPYYLILFVFFFGKCLQESRNPKKTLFEKTTKAILHGMD